MKGEYLITKILSDEEVDLVQKQLKKAENEDWNDGISSLGGEEPRNEEEIKESHRLKLNYELVDNTIHDKLCKIILPKFYDNFDVIKNLVPEHVSTPIISKMSKGCFYKTHLDSSPLKEYSASLFLNSPDTYIGGELKLKLSTGIKKFKLNAGEAIIYETGTTHEVTEVVDGIRYVGVFWIKSFIKDKFIRGIASDLYHLKSLTDFHREPLSIEDSMQSPVYLIDEILQNLKRNYSDHDIS